jgi:hypothetical protein
LNSLFLLKALTFIKSLLRPISAAVPCYKTSPHADLTATYLLATRMSGIQSFLGNLEGTQSTAQSVGSMVELALEVVNLQYLMNLPVAQEIMVAGQATWERVGRLAERF